MMSPYHRDWFLMNDTAILVAQPEYDPEVQYGTVRRIRVQIEGGNTPNGNTAPLL